jgi:hypothetical protein
MLKLDIPSRYLALAPVIVTSPTARCGTTLLQRLLSASDNAFLYGEEVGHHIRVLTDWFVDMMRHLESNEANLDGDFARALAGGLSDWRPGLTAPTNVMFRAFAETFYQIPMTLSEYGASLGRPIWGYKFPAYSHDTIITLLTLMPQAKVVYVFRNPFDALKSAKARRFVTDADQAQAFAANWAHNMTEVLSLEGHERILFVKYEDLIAQRPEYIDRLQGFTGIQRIDAREFDLKVNTFAGDEADGHAPGQYIAPAPLTEADQAAVLACAGALLERW